jgi:hypothetical protein
MALLPSSSVEDGRRAIFRNVVNFRFYIFVFYIVYFVHIKDDGQSPRNKWFTTTFLITNVFTGNITQFYVARELGVDGACFKAR